jgi:3-hydroxyacyl-[acyl-carrier-protein] dehydratase
MAPPFLFDLSTLDFNNIVVPIEGIRAVIPQRFEMELLSSILYIDDDVIVGVKDVTNDEFWVRGHIPGRPLMPGVMMIECAAQLCAYQTMKRHPEMGFIGFARCDDAIFRGTVRPPSKLIMIAKMTEITRRRAIARCQGICEGKLVFEATITGMSV